jgi:type I restriction-modification system DNA methylase subunit
VAISNNRYLSDYKELQNQDVQKALAEILSVEEWESLRKSASTAYYTPEPIIRYCWQMVEQLGFTSGDILEPTCGVGAFVRPESRLYGCRA